MKFHKTIIAVGFLAVAASPAAAQQINLPQDVMGALVQLYKTASYQCQSGVQASCQTAVAIDQQAMAMSHALTVCQQGNQEACMWYQQGVTQVGMAYQQIFSPQMNSGGGQAFDTNAMTQQHMQNMNNLQQQFNAGQQQYQQQQNLNDQMFQNYMGTLR